MLFLIKSPKRKIWNIHSLFTKFHPHWQTHDPPTALSPILTLVMWPFSSHSVVFFMDSSSSHILYTLFLVLPFSERTEDKKKLERKREIKYHLGQSVGGREAMTRDRMGGGGAKFMEERVIGVLLLFVF